MAGGFEGLFRSKMRHKMLHPTLPTPRFIPPSPPPARSAAPHRNSVVLTRAKRSAKGGNKRALEGEFRRVVFEALNLHFSCLRNGSLLESMLLCWDICWYSFLWSLSSSSMLWILQGQVPGVLGCKEGTVTWLQPATKRHGGQHNKIWKQDEMYN